MLKRYGEQALKESAARATELTLADDGLRPGWMRWNPLGRTWSSNRGTDDSDSPLERTGFELAVPVYVRLLTR